MQPGESSQVPQEESVDGRKWTWEEFEAEKVQSQVCILS